MTDLATRLVMLILGFEGLVLFAGPAAVTCPFVLCSGIPSKGFPFSSALTAIMTLVPSNKAVGILWPCLTLEVS